MTSWSSFIERSTPAGAEARDVSGCPVLPHFGDPAGEYRALRTGFAIVDRSTRGLVELTGKDRISWLHNLTTNQVRTLGPNDGNYAFALNVKGRIEFDLNMLVLPECVRLDIDRAFVSRAIRHFDKYTIVEDVRLADRTGEFVRLGIAGPRMGDVMASLKADAAIAMAQLASGSLSWRGADVPYFRHDFCGVPAVELLLPADRAVEFWESLTPAAGFDAVEAMRIEAGIPRSTLEIHDDILPAETDQLERGVSYQKGCYLGQEVVERMRSRGGLARRLVGVVVAGAELPPRGAEFHIDQGATVGKLTSACQSPALGSIIALGYVKLAATAPGTRLHVAWDGGVAEGVVSALPFPGSR